MASASPHAAMHASCSPRVTSARADGGPRRRSPRVHLRETDALRRDDTAAPAPARRASASGRGRWTRAAPPPSRS